MKRWPSTQSAFVGTATHRRLFFGPDISPEQDAYLRLGGTVACRVCGLHVACRLVTDRGDDLSDVWVVGKHKHPSSPLTCTGSHSFAGLAGWGEWEPAP